jgi:hypothetical protein
MKIFERLGQWLRQRLSSSKVILQSGSELSELEVDRLGLLWIVARADCVFRVLDLTSVPSAKRTQALAAQIPLFSPYKETGYWHCMQNGVALVWLWDEHHRLQIASQQKIAAAEECLVLPESCLTELREAGSAVYCGVEGYFGQIWAAQRLVAETWWPQEPDLLGWKQFQRGAGMPATEKPKVSNIDLALPVPWPFIRLKRLDGRSAEYFLVRGLAIAFIFLFVFQLTASLRLLTEQWQLENQITEMQSQHQQSIARRDMAFELREKANYLQTLHSGRQLKLLENISERVPGGLQDRLVIWQYQEGLLEFVVQDDNPDLEAYVRNLEKIDLLSGVNVEPLTKTNQIKINAVVSAP